MNQQQILEESQYIICLIESSNFDAHRKANLKGIIRGFIEILLEQPENLAKVQEKLASIKSII